MTLKIENGTGMADADALVSLASFKTYCADHGYEIASYEDAEIEQAIRRASNWLTFSWTYKGIKLNGRNQRLAWPRAGATDQEGYSVSSSSVPEEIQFAACEATWYELSEGTLSPAVVMTERVRSEVLGPMTTNYANTSDDADASRPVLTIVRDLIAGLLPETAETSGITMRASRG